MKAQTYDVLSWLTCSDVASADPTHAGRRRGNGNNGGAGLEQVRPANHRKGFSSVLRKTG